MLRRRQVLFYGAPLLGSIIQHECQSFNLGMAMGRAFGGPSKDQLQSSLMQSSTGIGIDPEQFKFSASEKEFSETSWNVATTRDAAAKSL